MPMISSPFGGFLVGEAPLWRHVCILMTPLGPQGDGGVFLRGDKVSHSGLQDHHPRSHGLRE